jgi:hypothetical protein
LKRWAKSSLICKLGQVDPRLRKQLRRKHAELLFSLGQALQSWAYYAQGHGRPYISFRTLLVPADAKGCVVMDATASTNVIYQLHKESRRVEPPSGSRDYSNVTVHTSAGHYVGKTTMGKMQRWWRNALLMT